MMHKSFKHEETKHNFFQQWILYLEWSDWKPFWQMSRTDNKYNIIMVFGSSKNLWLSNAYIINQKRVENHLFYSQPIKTPGRTNKWPVPITTGFQNSNNETSCSTSFNIPLQQKPLIALTLNLLSDYNFHDKLPIPITPGTPGWCVALFIIIHREDEH